MSKMVDLRSLQSPIKDQGRRGTCVAFAATAAHEMLRGGNAELCLEFLHWASKERDGLPKASEGTTLEAAVAALTELGQPLESVWPYDEMRNQWSAAYQPPAGALQAAISRRITGGTRVELTSNMVRTALDAGHAVMLGIRLYATWYYPSQTGHIDMPAAGDTLLGGHAVLVVGYKDSQDNTGGHFVVRNSWGEAWADAGYGYLPYNYVDTHGLAACYLLK